METTPTPEQFEALARAIENFTINLGERFDAIIDDIGVQSGCLIPENSLIELSDRFRGERENSFHQCFDNDNDVVYDWMDSQPTFKIALQKLGFKASGDGNPYKEIIERQIARPNWRPHFLKASALRHATLHLAYVGGVAKACHGFTSGKRRKAALEGPKAIERMLSLMSEIEQIRDNTDFLGRPISIGGRYWKMTRSSMEDALEHLFSTTKRNDKDLPARLMASEIIRLHVKLFSDAHKNVVFHIMGLPIFERPLEMKTIERLIALENTRAEGIKSSVLTILGREIIC
ncbi:hypothetical protein [Pseudomonas putida]|uniref:hypothetical protein n=1 Tax=Pseudomonas putida TaxID=303 RepID=UPI0035A4CE86